MEQPEAEALANISGQQTGLTARAEQTGDGAWQLTLVDGGQTHTFPDAHSYRVWHDRRAGVTPEKPARKSFFARLFGSGKNLPEENIPDESIPRSVLHDPQGAGLNPRGSGLLDRSMENQEEKENFVYRETHGIERP